MKTSKPKGPQCLRIINLLFFLFLFSFFSVISARSRLSLAPQELPSAAGSADMDHPTQSNSEHSRWFQPCSLPALPTNRTSSHQLGCLVRHCVTSDLFRRHAAFLCQARQCNDRMMCNGSMFLLLGSCTCCHFR